MQRLLSKLVFGTKIKLTIQNILMFKDQYYQFCDPPEMLTSCLRGEERNKIEKFFIFSPDWFSKEQPEKLQILCLAYTEFLKQTLCFSVH